jgi:DNA-binding transcriptional LysR family regulator
MTLSAQGGKVIFAEVERALGLLEEAENRITERNKSATGTIRIGASDTIFEYFLADKIVEFHERFPAVKIELMADFTPDTIEKLKLDKCDVAFVNLPITADSELKLHGNCMRLNDIFITSEKFSELTNEPISLSTLKKYPLILMDENTVARKSLDNFLSSVGVSVTPSIEVGSWDLMKRLVRKGMGVGVIPREYALQDLEEKALYEIKTDIHLPVRSVGILLRKNASISYALHSFIDLFIQTGKGL